jgi:hypothetical protein
MGEPRLQPRTQASGGDIAGAVGGHRQEEPGQADDTTSLSALASLATSI